MKNTNTDILKQLNEITDHDDKNAEALPDRRDIIDALKEIQVVMLPDYFHFHGLSMEEALNQAEITLHKAIDTVYAYHKTKADTDQIITSFVESMPDMKKLMMTDIQAIYDGDPAAKSKSEVILCYPGFYAIMIYRIAHVLYELRVPYIPRVMSEYAHGKTGIDINPGAKIGTYFCIDHGTGIVVGETAVIGDHVKLYQGVTIGAKSFELDENGFPVKGGKRHPNIGNNVIVYSNATILGGDTCIGDNCIIGGSVWLTHSVEEGRTVYNTKNEQCKAFFNGLGTHRKDEKDKIETN